MIQLKITLEIKKPRFIGELVDVCGVRSSLLFVKLFSCDPIIINTKGFHWRSLG